MADIIKNSSNYGLYIVEESPGTDDWLDDHDHIKELDWDEVTAGTDGIFLPYSGEMEVIPEFTMDIMYFFKGQGADMSLGEGKWVFKMKGRFGGTEAQINAKEIEMLTIYNKHLVTGTPLYLGYRKHGEIWEPFIDSGDAIKYYLKGKLTLIPYKRRARTRYIEWRVVFQAVW